MLKYVNNINRRSRISQQVRYTFHRFIGAVIIAFLSSIDYSILLWAIDLIMRLLTLLFKLLKYKSSRMLKEALR